MRAAQAMAAHTESGAAAEAPPTTSAPPPTVDIPLKSYTTAEIDRILAGVQGTGPNLLVDLRTQRGTITCRLDADGAPQTVANFVALATGQVEWRGDASGKPQRRPFYDGLSFHRIVSNFVIQTGNPGRSVGGGPGWTIPRETGANVAFDAPGAMAMVDAEPSANAHGSQFFIAVRADKELPKKYGAFGRCGQPDLVRKISNEPEGRSRTVPQNPVKIFSAKVYRGP